jgi:hypothetical protein
MMGQHDRSEALFYFQDLDRAELRLNLLDIAFLVQPGRQTRWRPPRIRDDTEAEDTLGKSPR